MQNQLLYAQECKIIHITYDDVRKSLSRAINVLSRKKINKIRSSTSLNQWIDSILAVFHEQRAMQFGQLRADPQKVNALCKQYQSKETENIRFIMRNFLHQYPVTRDVAKHIIMMLKQTEHYEYKASHDMILEHKSDYDLQHTIKSIMQEINIESNQVIYEQFIDLHFRAYMQNLSTRSIKQILSDALCNSAHVNDLVCNILDQNE